jgi:hypothetical protein
MSWACCRQPLKETSTTTCTKAWSGIKSLTIFIEILNFKIERVAPLPFSIKCVLDVLVDWHAADMERCSCIILLSWKNHDLLIMSSSFPVLKSTWIPNFPLELSIYSSSSLLLLLLSCYPCRLPSDQLLVVGSLCC